MASAHDDKTSSGNGNGNHDLPFARTLFEAADRLRGSVESAEYKHWSGPGLVDT